MVQGTSRGAAAGPLGLLLALCVALLAVPATAPASPSPPSAAAFERATDRLLDRAPFTGRVGAAAPSDEEGVSFPDDLYLTLYGAPQLPGTELGVRSPKSAVRQVKRRSREFEDEGVETVVPGFDLIGVVANSTPGPDRKYRTRQPDEIIGPTSTRSGSPRAA